MFPEEVLNIQSKYSKWLDSYKKDQRTIAIQPSQLAVYSELKLQQKHAIRSLGLPNMFHVFNDKKSFNLKDKSRDANAVQLDECYDILLVDGSLDLFEVSSMELRKQEGWLTTACVEGGTVAFQQIEF